MRRTLLATALETAAANLRFRDRVEIFEVGKVFLPQPGEELPDEPRRLSIVMTGPRHGRHWLATAGERRPGLFRPEGRRGDPTGALARERRQSMSRRSILPSSQAALPVSQWTTSRLACWARVHPAGAGCLRLARSARGSCRTGPGGVAELRFHRSGSWTPSHPIRRCCRTWRLSSTKASRRLRSRR